MSPCVIQSKDMFSLRLLFRELHALHTSAQLPPEPSVSFRVVVLWAERERRSERYAWDRDYWRGRCPRLHPGPLLLLAAGSARAAGGEVPALRSRRCSGRVERAAWQAIKAAARRLGTSEVSETSVLLASFALVFIVSRGDGGLAPPGVAGELVIAGAGLARGNLHDEALTRQRFDAGVPEPLRNRGVRRIYRSGDLARFTEDGGIEHLGKLNRTQAKINGQRVELGEIEAKLRSCDLVKDCAVLYRELRPQHWFLVACVVPLFRGVLEEDVAAAEPPALGASARAHLAERLPGHMVPQHYVLLERLPLSPSGKLDGAALPGVQEPRPEVESGEALTGARQRLAALWEELLRARRRLQARDLAAAWDPRPLRRGAGPGRVLPQARVGGHDGGRRGGRGGLGARGACGACEPAGAMERRVSPGAGRR